MFRSQLVNNEIFVNMARTINSRMLLNDPEGSQTHPPPKEKLLGIMSGDLFAVEFPFIVFSITYNLPLIHKGHRAGTSLTW